VSNPGAAALLDGTDPRELVGNLLEASTEYAIVGTDLDGTILIWNEGARRLYGYDAGTLVGTATTDVLHVPEDVERGLPAETRRMALAEGKWAGTVQRIRRDGSRFTARVVMTPRPSGTGQPVGFLVISNDISQEIRLTEQLQATQFYTRSLIESNVDALMTTDPLGIITDVNGQMEALTGRRREQLIGTPFKECFTEPARAEDGIRLALAEGEVTNYELTARRPDGWETTVSYNASTLKDRDGKLEGVFAAARDVTDRRRFEKTLQEKNVELEKASQAKDRFLASMSHELRTPLNAILGFTGTLLMKLPGPLTGEQESQLSTVRNSAKHLLSIINDLLDLAKIESGKIELSLERVSCRSVVKEVVDTLQPLASAKNLALDAEMPSATSLC
jgi:PAS domain S-box-containing protein